MVDVPLKRLRFGQTARRDAWWFIPIITFAVLGSFVVYATWAGLQGDHYHYGNYLSPFYSPEIWGNSPHRMLGPPPSWWPSAIPFSPALLILAFPAGFRLTCYYYRGSYYKAFWADPPSCAVGEPRKSYWGEASFPLIAQNIHRYFLYAAVAFIFFLGHDAYKAMWFTGPTGHQEFGIGFGTILLTANVVLLAGYTFGCHSMRHLVGGFLDRLSERPACAFAYKGVCKLNSRHHLWAWPSLVVVALCDVYVRLLSMGVISDPRII